jgi:hypothetical protein
MAAFESIMITCELQLVSLGFEAAGAKAPFISHALRGAEAPLFHESHPSVALSSHSIKPVPLPELSPAREPGPPIGRSQLPPPPAFHPHTQSPPSGQQPSRNFPAKP